METPNLSAHRFLLLGVAALLLLIGGFSAWSATARISGAIVAHGTLKGDDDKHPIQSQSGGTIVSINVRDGDVVDKNTQLAALDGQHLLSQREIFDGQYYEILAQISRLEAEQENATQVSYRAELHAQNGIDSLIADQTRLFEIGKKRRAASEAHHKSRVAQIGHRQTRLHEQYKANQTQLALVQTDLERQNSLLEKGLTQLDKILRLQREEASLQGALVDISGQLSELELQKNELEIQRTSKDIEDRNALMAELRELRAKAAELSKKRRYVDFELDNLTLRAPVSGIVQGLNPSHTQAVIPPGHTLMHLVPMGSGLRVMARVDPLSIGHIFIGQDALITIETAHLKDQSSLSGKVAFISADVLEDPRSAQRYYEVEIDIMPTPAKGELNKTGPPLGMPVTVFIKTNTSSPISYLIHPFQVFFDKALREPSA